MVKQEENIDEGTGSLVQEASDHIKKRYEEGTRSLEEAQEDSLMLLSARMQESAQIKGVTSMTYELAVKATESVRDDDWGPMLDFLSHESTGIQLFAGPGNAPWIENLISSFQVKEAV